MCDTKANQALGNNGVANHSSPAHPPPVERTLLNGRDKPMHARGRIVVRKAGTVSPVSLIERFGPSGCVTDERRVDSRIDPFVT
jgi:hypothetical protein